MNESALDEVFEHAMDGDFDAAIAELDQLVAPEAAHARLWALRALLQLGAGRSEAAAVDVRKAVALDAEDAYVNRAAAEIALERREPAEAIAAARRAQAAEPGDLESIVLEAHARVLLGQWKEVLDRTTYVLSEDEGHEQAAVLRAFAAEAQSEGRGAPDRSQWTGIAARFPHNALARAGHGWHLLATADAGTAREEFRQALAMEPGSEWAKSGMVLALKAKYPGYGQLLRYFFWLRTLPPRTQTLLAVGGVLGYNFLRRAAEANPAIKPFVIPLLIAYVLFVLASWLADPLLNLLLLGSAEGRATLSADDRASGQRVGAALGTGLLLALVGVATGAEGLFLSAVVIGFSSLTIAGAYNCAPGRYRSRLLVAAGSFVLLGAVAGLAPDPLAGLAFGLGLLGVVASTWISRSWAERS